ncbi:MAG: hypothetical protein WDW38_010492 [Sanguina aurantia]
MDRAPHPGPAPTASHHAAHAHHVTSPLLPFSSDLSAGLVVLSPQPAPGPVPVGPNTTPLFRERLPRARHSPGGLPTPPWRAGRHTCAVAWNGKGCRT